MFRLDKKQHRTMIPREEKRALLRQITVSRRFSYCMFHKERETQTEPFSPAQMGRPKLKLGEVRIARICKKENYKWGNQLEERERKRERSRERQRGLLSLWLSPNMHICERERKCFKRIPKMGQLGRMLERVTKLSLESYFWKMWYLSTCMGM